MGAHTSQLKICHKCLTTSDHWTVLLIMVLVICSIFKVSEVCAASLTINNSQVWVDKLTGIEIHFTYELNMSRIKNLNELNFTVQDLKTNKNLNLTGKVVVLNSPDPTFEFDNLSALDGHFSIICPFLNEGIHQVIINIHDANNFAVALASFRINVPPSSS